MTFRIGKFNYPRRQAIGEYGCELTKAVCPFSSKDTTK